MITDLISRQDAIDVLRIGEELLKRVLDDMDVVGQDREKYSWGLGLIESYISDIEELPSAEPVRHGKFIGTEYDGYADGNPVYYEWKCSECGCVFEEDEPTYRYCPNCGTRMDEE